MSDKKILDMTCGGKSIWFNKAHPAAVYCDCRREDLQYQAHGEYTIHIAPDILCDFTDLPFPDESFSLVVFDPPHMARLKDSWMKQKYGVLQGDWRTMLHDGFAEGMRVLRPDGVLIFKWAETEFPASEVWKAIGQKPLFGHHSGKKSTTFWGCFMKGQV